MWPSKRYGSRTATSSEPGSAGSSTGRGTAGWIPLRRKKMMAVEGTRQGVTGALLAATRA
ncbi:hypothetical protein TR74_15555 [Carbonactinospora thermoautotrophica]|uniref:Uncharacterized protein n=1 Tax=Carbonactinospora thermoautotrophica TaxID=1469144 RepID=A0A132NE96_9ACTN|nr:hypothetical protein TR74_15555 [Carbonactinospora thermoautotrophica]